MQIHGIAIGRPVPIPLLAEPVRAGFPSPADDFIEEEIDLQRLLIANRPATFLVLVSGDCMVLAKLFDGDLALVDRSMTPRNGEVVVVDVDGEPSFKVWKRIGPRVILSFANFRFPEYRRHSDAVVEVWGVVTSSITMRRRGG